jgi:hypothetical protein
MHPSLQSAVSTTTVAVIGILLEKSLAVENADAFGSLKKA